MLRLCAGLGPRGGPLLGLTHELVRSRGARFLLYWGTAGLPATLARLHPVDWSFGLNLAIHR